MASINISESDFKTIAWAARDAMDKGDTKQAHALDKIARKINAALSNSNPMARVARMCGGLGKGMSWEDVPSTLDTRFIARGRYEAEHHQADDGGARRAERAP